MNAPSPESVESRKEMQTCVQNLRRLHCVHTRHDRSDMIARPRGELIPVGGDGSFILPYRPSCGMEPVGKMPKSNSFDAVLAFAICACLAAFLVWFQSNSMGEAVFNMAVGDLNWEVLGFIGVSVGTNAFYAVISDKLPRYARLILAVLIPVGSFLLCVNAMRGRLR